MALESEINVWLGETTATTTVDASARTVCDCVLLVQISNYTTRLRSEETYTPLVTGSLEGQVSGHFLKSLN